MDKKEALIVTSPAAMVALVLKYLFGALIMRNVRRLKFCVMPQRVRCIHADRFAHRPQLS